MPLNPTLFSGLNKHGTATGDLLPFTDAGTNIGMPDQRFGHVVVGPHSGVILHATAIEAGLSNPVEFGLSIDTSGGPDNGKLVINTASGNLWAIDQLGNISSPTTGSTLVDSTHTFSIKHSSTLSGIFEISDQTQNTIDSPPANLRWAVRMTPNPMNGAQESAAIITRIDPLHVGDNFYGIYGEITANQVDTSSAFMKVVSKGAGDAVYIASYGTGAALEAAAYQNGNRGIISTLQNVGLAYDQFGNNTLFQGVWGYDGTGGAIVPPNFGMFYAARSLGNSLVTRKQDPAASGAVDGRTEWKIMEFDLSRNRVEIYNDGTSRFLSKVATGSFNYDSPALNLVGSYWNGSSATDLNSKLITAVSGGNAALRIYTGPVSSESLVSIFSSAGLDLQAHNLTGVANATIQNLTITSSASLPAISIADLSSTTLEVSSTSTLANVTATKLNVSGLTSLTTLQNSGNVAVGGTMSVAGTVTLSGNLNVLGSTNLTTAGMITDSIQANEVIGGTVLVSGQMTVLNSGSLNSLGVIGNATVLGSGQFGQLHSTGDASFANILSTRTNVTTDQGSGPMVIINGAPFADGSTPVLMFGTPDFSNVNAAVGLTAYNLGTPNAVLHVRAGDSGQTGNLAAAKITATNGFVGSSLATTGNTILGGTLSVPGTSTLSGQVTVLNSGAFNSLGVAGSLSTSSITNSGVILLPGTGQQLNFGTDFGGGAGNGYTTYNGSNNTAILIGPTDPVTNSRTSGLYNFGVWGIAIGRGTYIATNIAAGFTSDNNLVIGNNAAAFAAGKGAYLGDNNASTGTISSQHAFRNTVIGAQFASVQGFRNIAVGNGANAAGSNNISIGDYSAVGGTFSTGAEFQKSIAIGNTANVQNNFSVALGNSATTHVDHQIMLGTSAENVTVPGTLTTAGLITSSGSLNFTGFSQIQFTGTHVFESDGASIYVRPQTSNGGTFFMTGAPDTERLRVTTPYSSFSTSLSVNPAGPLVPAAVFHVAGSTLLAGTLANTGNAQHGGTLSVAGLTTLSGNVLGLSTISGVNLSGLNVTSQSTGAFKWDGRTQLLSPSDGQLQILQAATNGGESLLLGSATAGLGLKLSHSLATLLVQDNTGTYKNIFANGYLDNHNNGLDLTNGNTNTLIRSGGGVLAATIDASQNWSIAGSLNLGAGTRVNQSTQVTTYSILATDYVLFFDATTAGFTATLPDATLAANIGRAYKVKKVDATANVVTIATTGGQKIDGASTLTLPAQNVSYELISNGSNWFIF